MADPRFACLVPEIKNVLADATGAQVQNVRITESGDIAVGGSAQNGTSTARVAVVKAGDVKPTITVNTRDGTNSKNITQAPGVKIAPVETGPKGTPAAAHVTDMSNKVTSGLQSAIAKCKL